jgi:iron complex outermembrane recepter protein
MHRSIPVAAVAAALAGATWAQSGVDQLLDQQQSFPVVITPARLRQSLADVPASVSIISGETLRRFGIRSVAEALRLVPGMAVTQTSGSDYRVGYHGTNILSPRRMNVLIDGASVYRPAFSEVIWSQLPVVVEDIDRIEVTRGPNSAAYGPNSMLAIVNIITREPSDVDRAYGVIRAGSSSEREATARAGFSLGPSSIRLTASRSAFSGFDEIARDATGHDGFRRDLVDLRSRTQLSDTDTLEVRGSLVEGNADVEFADDFQQSYPDRRFRDWYLGGSWVRQVSATHELKIRLDHASQRDRQSWRTCPPALTLLPELFELWRANPTYTPAVLTGRVPPGASAADAALFVAAVAAVRGLGARALAPTCVTSNQDAQQARTDVELQDTYVLTERLRFVVGAGARWQRGESLTYLGGAVASQLRWTFGNLEARPIDWLTLNVGGYHERNSLSPSSFSPRAAVNVHLAPGQSFRLVWSKGSRSPDIQEQRSNWTYTFDDVSPPLNGASNARFYQSRTGPGTLVSERIRSVEFGYLLNAQRLGLLLDVKVFSDRLTSLISERTNLAGALPTNDGAVDLRGAEVQVSLALSPRSWAFANLAYLDNIGANQLLERSQYARHSGSAGVTHEFNSGWRGSLAYFGSSGNGLAESPFGRLDLTVAKSGDLLGWSWTALFGLRRLDNKTTSFANGDTAQLFARFDDRLQGFAQLSVRLP